MEFLYLAARSCAGDLYSKLYIMPSIQTCGVEMSESALKEVLEEVKVVREKVDRLEELVEERLLGVEEPLKDEVEAIDEYTGAKEKGSVKLIRIEDLEKEP